MEAAARIAQTGMGQMGHACLWGSLLIVAVSVLCRFAPRLPAATRAWLWWLVCAKMIFDLCGMAPISLPILPAPAVRRAASVPVRPFIAQGILPSARGIPSRPAAASEDETRRGAAPQTARWPLCLFAAWVLGSAASFGLEVRRSLALGQLRRGTFPAPLPNADFDTLARQMGLRRLPDVLTGPNIWTPCVTGWLHPAILLPLSLSETLSLGELRLTLAHEMAHVIRGDLPLAIVPALARSLLFFHPLVWLASAEWAAAREEACDALALSATSLSRADYGCLLLKLAGPKVSAPALGLSPGYHGLRRRLIGLTRPQQSPRWARLFVLALPLLLPWRLTAASSPAGFHHDSALRRLYTITPLADGVESDAAGLNNAGQIALTVHDLGAGTQGFAGNADAPAALGALPKHHASLAYSINSQGEAAGTSLNIPGHGRAFVWDGAAHRLGSLPGYPYSEARGLNDSGQVAGFSETGSADRSHAWITRAFLHQPGGPMTDLGTLGGLYSAAYGINSLGTVVGKADTADFGATHAFAWADGQITDLGTLGGANSAAYAVNDGGEIAGASEINDSGTRHAFLYTSGQMHDLGTLPAMTDSRAYALNNRGEIVGTSQRSREQRATLWQNGHPTDLNSLLPPRSGWTLTEAHAINDHGQIAGQGFLNGKPCAFLLIPATH